MAEQKDRGIMISEERIESAEGIESAPLLGESAKSILLMLDNKCLSPCYCFGSDNPTTYSMSPQTLNKVLAWASQLEAISPGILYLVGAPQSLDKNVREILETVAASVICSPMDPRDQEKFGLPYVNSQVLVFSCLKEFTENNEKAMGRSCIIHIECEEISKLSSTMQDSKGLSLLESSIQFRPKNIQQWSSDQLRDYKDQLIKLQEFKFRLQTAGFKTTKWQLLPVNRCLAIEYLVTIGPDGLCYPCPAFYHAGQTYDLGAIEHIASDNLFKKRPDHKCKLCQSMACEACLFCEAGLSGDTKNCCELVGKMDENMSIEQIVKSKDRSGYLFENLFSNRIEEMDNETNEEENYLSGNFELLDDITYDDFTNSLRSIHSSIYAQMKGETEVVENCISQCEKVIESTPKTIREKFAFENFANDLENILSLNPNTDTLRGGGQNFTVLNNLLEKYSNNTQQLSRKHEFYENVIEILHGIVSICEKVNANQTLISEIISYTPSNRQSEKVQENDKVELSEHEVATIQRIYQIALGWETLYITTIRAMDEGFVGLEKVEQAAKSKSSKARREIARWFNKTMDLHGWEREGYALIIDFDANINVSHARYIEKHMIKHSQPVGDYFSIMPLEGIELEVYERLALLVEKEVSTVKEYLERYMTDLEVDYESELEEAVCELGSKVLDLKRWFAGMAIEHGWPTNMHFRVHTDRKMVEARMGN